MDINVVSEEGKTIVSPTGEVDMSTSVDLRSALKKVLSSKPANIVIDLKQVEYIDSSGLATLVECLQETGKYGGKLQLIIENSMVLDVFKLARLDQVFDIKSS